MFLPASNISNNLRTFINLCLTQLLNIYFVFKITYNNGSKCLIYFQGFYLLFRLWGRRLTGGNILEEDLAGFLEDRDVFPSAQVEIDEAAKSRPSSPCQPCQDPFYQDLVQNTFAPICKAECKCTSTESRSIEVNGANIGDIPASYRIANIRKHEFPAIGIFVDPRVVPGFKYRVRPIQQNGHQEKWLFKRRALVLESIGRGYSRRITFKAGRGDLNHNPHYFWADSRPEGFAFELELVTPGDKFTVFDASRLPVGTLEITRNQVPQEEVGHRILEDGSIEKTVRIRSLCKVEWYEESNCDVIVPMSGVAISIKSKGFIKTKLIGVTIGSHPRRGFTLKAGINNRLRSTKVRGESIADVPTTYTITGLDAHELPVIGTYVDPRIVPGFYYRVRPAAGKRRPLFNGRMLKLTSIGMGYGKRITFASDSLNHPDNYFWSDSHPDGLGFEPSAVRVGMKFEILAGKLRLGEATVFRADVPQVEKDQIIKKNRDGMILLTKHIHIDVTCHVTIDTRFDKSPEPLIMRISGTAIVTKTNKNIEAQLIRLENIGLDSQLNILFSTQWEKLVFIPI